MSKVYFRFGTMDAGKSMNLIAAVHNYKKKGADVLVFKPAVDERSATGFVESRTGISTECIDLYAGDSITEHIMNMLREERRVSCIFVDEAQFLEIPQAMELLPIADNLKIPVIAYGLKTDFRGVLFSASEFLIRHADKIEEIKTMCRAEDCSRKALYNERLMNGEPVFEGNAVMIGDTDEEAEFSYSPKCRFHYMQDYVNAQTRKQGGK